MYLFFLNNYSVSINFLLTENVIQISETILTRILFTKIKFFILVHNSLK